MVKKIGVLFLGVAFLTGSAIQSAAQSEEETEFAAGIVNEVSNSGMVIFDSEEEMQITLEINAQTEIENTESLDDITKGDEVYVDYTIAENGNIALNIFKVGLTEEDYDEADYPEDENLIELNMLEGSYDEPEENR